MALNPLTVIALLVWLVAYADLAFALIAGFSIGGYFGVFAAALVALAGGLDLVASRRTRRSVRADPRYAVALVFAALGALWNLALGIYITFAWYVDGVDKGLAISIASLVALAAVFRGARGVALRAALLSLVWAAVALLVGSLVFIPPALALIAAAVIMPPPGPSESSEPTRRRALGVSLAVLASGLVLGVTYASMQALGLPELRATGGPHVFVQESSSSSGAEVPATPRPYVADAFEPDEPTSSIAPPDFLRDGVTQERTLGPGDVDYLAVPVSSLPLRIVMRSDASLSYTVDDGTGELTISSSAGQDPSKAFQRSEERFVLEHDGVLSPDRIVYIEVTAYVAKKRTVVWTVTAQWVP